jgi:tetratricopeptide (TPR) repeat protein
MKLAPGIVTLTVAVMAFGAGVSTPAWSADKPEKAAAKPGVSRQFSKDINAAQKALTDKNFPEAISKLTELQGKSGKSPYDEYIINELMAFAQMNSQNFAEAARLFETSVGSEFMPAEDLPQRYKVLATLNYQTKTYDKAAQYGAKAVEADPADDNMVTLTAQAYYLGKDYTKALEFTQSFVDKQIASNTAPKEQTLLLLRSACVNLDDMECTAKATEKLVSYAPKPEYWKQLLDPMFRAKGQNATSLLYTYRLAKAVDALNTSDEYLEYADLALQAGSPGEAQKVLEQGIQRQAFTTPSTTEQSKKQLDSAKRQAEADKVGLDKTAKDAAGNAVGQRDHGVGLAFYGYEQYDKAVESLQRALTKSGVKSPAETQLLLGISQLAAGKKEDAKASFGAVKGDPQLERLAGLWALHAKA